MMLNQEDKLKSPDFLNPSPKEYNLEMHKEKILNIQSEINDCIKTLDFRKKVNGFEMPRFGYMSIFEWLNFSVFLILRHTNQLADCLSF